MCYRKFSLPFTISLALLAIFNLSLVVTNPNPSASQHHIQLWELLY
jgi:hypothetical protein